MTDTSSDPRVPGFVVVLFVVAILALVAWAIMTFATGEPPDPARLPGSAVK